MKIIDLTGRILVLLLFFLGIGQTCPAVPWEPTINQVVWQGNAKRLILLVETKERPFYTPNANEEYDRMLNGENYTGLGCAGSARQFLIDNSGGKFSPEFIVVGPLTLSKSMGYYGGKPQPGEGNDGDVGKMVIEACKMAKELHGIDFSQFDYNNDNKVDNVYLFYSGPNDTTIPTPWPHASGVAGGGLVLDGKLVDSYAISQEMASETIRGGYTTFLHEFGHTLGLTDDYSGRLGRFSIYCDGTFNGGIIPVNFNAMERLMLGWLDYEVIDREGEYTLEPLAKNKGLLLKTNNPDEYFLFENRSNSGDITPWDSYFEYGGMLVWHIDRSQNIVTWSDGSGTHSNTAMGMWGMNAPNGSPSHPCHELIEADNDNNPSSYRAGMYFPGTRQVTKLSSQTHAEFKTWAGLPVGIEIDDIRQQADGNITFTVKKSDAASLSVTVKNSAGKLQTNTYISLTPVDEVERQSVMVTRSLVASGKKITGDTGLSGICLFAEIPTGKYRIEADKEGYLIYSGYVEVMQGDNTCEITLQAVEEAGGTELKWHTGQNLQGIFFVPGQIRAAGWDSSDLAPYVGQTLRKVNIQLGGDNNVADLYVFVDDQIVYCKPMENIVANGVTTIDLSAENIVIEAGRSLKTGYLLHSAADWPSTADGGPQVDGKGGLISTDNGKTWYLSNDLGVNWVISIVLHEEVDVPVESVGFDEPEIELAVGDEMTLHANVRPLEVANRKVTWESSDEAVVSVDATGKLKALATGNAVITATSVQNPEVYGECRVHVKMSSDMVDIIPYQREVKLSWPGYNPDYRWLVSWRQKGGEDYASAPAQTETSLYIRGLQPDTEYEGSISSSDSEEATPVEFVFSTKPLTSKYAVIALDKKRFAVGEAAPLVVSNIACDDYTITWKLNGTTIGRDEHVFAEPGTCELRAEVTFDDGTTDVLIKELEITK